MNRICTVGALVMLALQVNFAVYVIDFQRAVRFWDFGDCGEVGGCMVGWTDVLVVSC